ncbi:prostate and testis expressed protein 13-like isoform X1 [Leopardus geoffroyi]|uniref:prostate and testis expressed protein 13-like isoform X1 n=1 Tax=Leopardus geoffroyi TaxID=46844 RepID=UPI001E2614FB|nr:prostate and testis expressed protein 13-like isoform X1 [Leopardus geoffroyi]
MGLRLLLLLLLGTFTVVFMDEDIHGPKSKWLRFCHDCDFYDGFKCRGPKKRCWKFNLSLKSNKSCTTDHYYYNDPITGRYLYRYTKLSCNPCEEGMFQVYHDLLRETFCCTDKHMCNTGHDILEKSALFGEDKEHTIHDDVLP